MNKIETFKLALGKTNLMKADATRAELIDAGDDMFGGHTETRDTLAEMISARGRNADKTIEADGHEMHIWSNVQFQKGQPRVTVYFMTFSDGINIGMTA